VTTDTTEQATPAQRLPGDSADTSPTDDAPTHPPTPPVKLDKVGDRWLISGFDPV
jgi:hypothetical protein